ncbi:hypothetical protein GDO78_005470 [Eleutherodactylus coqui]|uniref:Uncharacterized protein n=1 Tax=Eleutherodactylus coqui TaxID=57060 RepID=A0A8J6FL20_ELECQ|nr:hypothetical protein GDO78_005470 [Eleutherodactylus coqui]
MAERLKDFAMYLHKLLMALMAITTLSSSFACKGPLGVVCRAQLVFKHTPSCANSCQNIPLFSSQLV